MRILRIVGIGVILAGSGTQAFAQGATPTDLAERLVTVASTLGGDGPQWTPDGSKILFPSSQGGGPAIWSVSPEGGSPSRVTGDVGPQIPKISPDGQSIAYMSDKSGSPELWLWSIS